MARAHGALVALRHADEWEWLTPTGLSVGKCIWEVVPDESAKIGDAAFYTSLALKSPDGAYLSPDGTSESPYMWTLVSCGDGTCALINGEEMCLAVDNHDLCFTVSRTGGWIVDLCDIPVVDVARIAEDPADVGLRIVRAASQVGFFAVVGHCLGNIGQELVDVAHSAKLGAASEAATVRKITLASSTGMVKARQHEEAK
eukprot:Sspe_Gene.86799::Locus_57578_Transcript_1_1_Confidence_1.000_Length_640::g.86799::m.86799